MLFDNFRSKLIKFNYTLYYYTAIQHPSKSIYFINVRLLVLGNIGNHSKPYSHIIRHGWSPC